QTGATNLGKHLAAPVQARGLHLPTTATIGLPHQRADHVLDFSVPDGPGRHHSARRGPLAVGPCGDLQACFAQAPTDRLDRMVFGPHLVDELADHRLRGSSSPAKKIEALRMISRSSVSRRFSALRRVISALSSVLTPGRAPASMSACTAHLRTVSLPSPNRRPIWSQQAVSDAYSPRCSATIRSARSLTAGSIFFGIQPSSSTRKGCGGKRGAVQWRI